MSLVVSLTILVFCLLSCEAEAILCILAVDSVSVMAELGRFFDKAGEIAYLGAPLYFVYILLNCKHKVNSSYLSISRCPSSNFKMLNAHWNTFSSNLD